ncbi:expressed unknown protein [Seminavis robusta]|uniref:Uncharacterized protein n=1 Tax=Seminavis robusta TaxID=568900 RepID=A0A9N8EWL4_9STRA|nr:expressed unknown protein [Seminavis robusta]|eukprot:Sro2232_g320110.1 n/a (703) ;mRNA; f:12949-15057
MAKEKSKRKTSNGPGALHSRQNEFKVGDRVSLEGLQSVRYNGRQGKIFSLPKHTSDPAERYGVLLDGCDKPIAIKPCNIVASQIVAQPGYRRDGRMTTEQQRKERQAMEDATTLTQKETMSADQMEMMRLMTTMFLTEEHQIKAFGRKIEPMPNFWEEVRQEPTGGIPKSVDKKWANEYLRTSYEQSHSLPHFMEMCMKLAEYEPTMKDFLKRLGTNDPRKVHWFFSQERRPGDIFPRGMNVYRYSSFIRHSFSNQAYRKEVLHLGTTHVAVGFVDLGILFAATLEDKLSGTRAGPLRFLGIELSVYAVAKTLVIWEMFQQTPPLKTREGDKHCRAILQAWFSATWSGDTEKAVRAAIEAIVGRSSKHFSLNPEVKATLNHWSAASRMTLGEARLRWSRNTSCASSGISEMRRRVDRIAMAQYELTGDFGIEDDGALAGNILMFDCQDGSAPQASSETIFSALDWKELALLLSPSTNILQAAEEFALTGIAKLAGWARDERVTVDLRFGKVEDLVEEIAAAKPWTMSWSNVLDYIDHRDFHRLARSCSRCGDTIHFGYSMNWVVDVFGVNLIDFLGPEKAKARADVMELANKNVAIFYKSLGWVKYLRLPPPCNPINTTSNYALELLHHRAWADYFFNIARRDGPCNVASVERAVGSPLSHTGGSTVAFTWTYDPEISFNAKDGTTLNQEHLLPVVDGPNSP